MNILLARNMEWALTDFLNSPFIWFLTRLKWNVNCSFKASPRLNTLQVYWKQLIASEGDLENIVPRACYFWKDTKIRVCCLSEFLWWKLFMYRSYLAWKRELLWRTSLWKDECTEDSLQKAIWIRCILNSVCWTKPLWILWKLAQIEKHGSRSRLPSYRGG